jgi:uncharacterized protein (TIGR03083 family)
VARVQQYYGADGAPFGVPTDPADVAAAWGSQRSRLRAWLAGLDDDAWHGPTRCSEWDVTQLVQHLASGAQFLGYALHQAGKGEPTSLLADFDAQATPSAAASMFAGLSTGELLVQLETMDANVERQLDGLAGEGWHAPAEAPMGRVPAYVSLNHFLFDSWVHEHDLMLPVGQRPLLDPREAAVVATYVLALAGLAATQQDPEPPSVEVHLTDLDLQLVVDMSEGSSTVTLGSAGGAARAAGTAAAVVDVATGRADPAVLTGDAAAAECLTHLARVMT